MTIDEIALFFDGATRVTVKTDYGTENTGVITGIENGFETDSGQDEIELDVGTHYLAIDTSHITSIEKH